MQVIGRCGRQASNPRMNIAQVGPKLEIIPTSDQ